jgi:hypothetical protein
LTQVELPSTEDAVASAEALIEEARRRQWRRRAGFALAAIAALGAALSVGFFGHGGARTKGSPSPASRGGRVGDQARGRTETSFVLVPAWLPPGINATGSGHVSTPGGLGVGSSVSGSVYVSEIGKSGESEDYALRIPFTLAYYGPQPGEGIRVTAEQGMTPAAEAFFLHAPGLPVVQLGAHRVTLQAMSSSSYVGASWLEHGVVISAGARGVSTSQFERFVRGLVERPYPRLLSVPRVPSCRRRSNFERFGRPKSERLSRA